MDDQQNNDNLSPALSIVFFIVVSIVGTTAGMFMGIKLMYDQQQPKIDQLTAELHQAKLDLWTNKSEYEQQLEIANKPRWDQEIQIIRLQENVAMLQLEVKQASAKTGTPTARAQLVATNRAYDGLAECTTALESTIAMTNSLMESAQAGTRAMETANININECLTGWKKSSRSEANEYSLIGDATGTEALLDVIKQHALAVGLENLTLQDDGMVWEGEPDGNGALFFQNCSNVERGCQEMAIQTTVYSNVSSELWLDNPVRLDDIEF